MSTRRAGCHESGLSGSTEARRSKPSTTNRVTIPAFYPIARFLLFFGIGATEKNPADAVNYPRRRAVMIEGGANPSRGFGPESAYARTCSGERLVRLVQPRLAWGARDVATRVTGPVTGFGDPLKQRTVKSSTMRGPQGLASKFNRRRCRIAKDHRRGISGRFSFRPAEIMRRHGHLAGCSWRLCPGGSLGHTAMTRGVTPSSDVTN